MDNLFRLDHMKFANSVAAKIMAETRRLNELAEKGQKPSIEDVKSIDLQELRDSFAKYGEDFLSDELLDRTITEIKANFDSIREYYPVGTKLLIAALPCDINGRLFTKEEIKNGDYLTAFVINKTGLSTGFGALRPSTYAQMMPKEIRDNCTFVVEKNNEFDTFAKQYRKAYMELKRILKDAASH